jgi:hypothetical protein
VHRPIFDRGAQVVCPLIVATKHEILGANHRITATCLSTLQHWEKEFASWARDVIVVMFSGVTPYLRKKLFKEVIQPVRFNVLITTYELVRNEASKLKTVPWQYLVVDEGHRLRNNSSKLTVCLTKEYNVRHRLLLTGTPLQVSTHTHTTKQSKRESLLVVSFSL